MKKCPQCHSDGNALTVKKTGKCLHNQRDETMPSQSKGQKNTLTVTGIDKCPHSHRDRNALIFIGTENTLKVTRTDKMSSRSQRRTDRQRTDKQSWRPQKSLTEEKANCLDRVTLIDI